MAGVLECSRGARALHILPRTFGGHTGHGLTIRTADWTATRGH
jgi:hypothetical protein